MGNFVVYAVKHRNLEVRENSRSGGVFTAVSDYVISKKGIVFGCIVDEKLKVRHISAENYCDRDRMRGSKYVQSSLGDTFADIKIELGKGRLVLFTGTPCQVAGLKKYVGEVPANLITIDIICHGVPSPKIWNLYVEWIEKKYKDKIETVDFRDKKKFGWDAHVESFKFKDGKFVSKDIYARLFYSHKGLRPSCYNCKYKNLLRQGDLTLGDFWGIDTAVQNFNDNKGVSLVLISSAKGLSIFEKVKADLEYYQVCIEDAMQEPLIGPFEEPVGRQEFWKCINQGHFKKLMYYYRRQIVAEKAIRTIKKVCGK